MKRKEERREQEAVMPTVLCNRIKQLVLSIHSFPLMARCGSMTSKGEGRGAEVEAEHKLFMQQKQLNFLVLISLSYYFIVTK